MHSSPLVALMAACLLCNGSAVAQSPLQQQIRVIAAEAKGRVSVACALPGTALNCDVEATSHPPMQSVFKLPLGLTILHQVEQGRLRLDQTVRFRRDDLILPKPYSPLQDKYPQGEVDVPLQTLLQLTVALSDNTAADLLLRLAGGAQVVNDYVASLGVQGFALRDGEGALHHDSALQYRNWFAPRGAVALLRRIADRSPLTPEHTALLLGWMRPAVPTRRLQAELPAGTVVAHKSGTSDEADGMAPATNDLGLITLPDGRLLAMAVFVTDAHVAMAARERVIAQIGKAVYDAAVGTR